MRDPAQHTQPDRDDFIRETQAARKRAEAVLLELQAAAADCDLQLQKQNRTDLVRLVTGRSSLDAAIASTRRMIETFDRAIEESRKAASQESTLPSNGSSQAAAGALRSSPLLWVAPARVRAELA